MIRRDFLARLAAIPAAFFAAIGWRREASATLRHVPQPLLGTVPGAEYETELVRTNPADLVEALLRPSPELSQRILDATTQRFEEDLRIATASARFGWQYPPLP